VSEEAKPLSVLAKCYVLLSRLWSGDDVPDAVGDLMDEIWWELPEWERLILNVRYLEKDFSNTKHPDSY